MVHTPGGSDLPGGRVEVVVITVVLFLHTSQIRRISLNAPRMISFLSLVVLSVLLIWFKSVILCKLFPNNLSNTFWSSVIGFVSSFVFWALFCKPTVAGSTTRTLGSYEIQGFSRVSGCINLVKNCITLLLNFQIMVLITNRVPLRSLSQWIPALGLEVGRLYRLM